MPAPPCVLPLPPLLPSRQLGALDIPFVELPSEALTQVGLGVLQLQSANLSLSCPERQLVERSGACAKCVPQPLRVSLSLTTHRPASPPPDPASCADLSGKHASPAHSPRLFLFPCLTLQIFQAYMLMLAEAPDQQWPIPEQLLALGQNAWVQSTKRIT